MKMFFLAIISYSFGFVAAAGVFTVFVAVGLVPRFIGKTKTANKIYFYEEMVIWGSIIGGIFSIYVRRGILNLMRLILIWPNLKGLVIFFEYFLKILFGLFGGMFVGCLAIAIAETLDSIPIFARRVKLRSGLRYVIFATALGKMVGSLLFFFVL